MNKEEIKKTKDKLNHCIEFYENMCEPEGVQPILTGEEKKALKTLLKYNDNLEQENEKLHHYKTLYQSLKRQKEELRDWLEQKTFKYNPEQYIYTHEYLSEMEAYKDVLEKLEELEGVDLN